MGAEFQFLELKNSEISSWLKSIIENVSIFLDNNERESEKHIDFYAIYERNSGAVKYFDKAKREIEID